MIRIFHVGLIEKNAVAYVWIIVGHSVGCDYMQEFLSGHENKIL